MSFLVVSAGHSGSMFLAKQLAKAPGWTVVHEPDDAVFPHQVNHRFVGKYGEVNSWLLASVRSVRANRKAVLLRDPHEILRSIDRDGHLSNDPVSAIVYVRIAISLLDSLVTEGMRCIRFDSITSDPEWVVSVSRMLGMTGLTPEMVDMEPVNQHSGESSSIELPPSVEAEFNYFKEKYRL